VASTSRLITFARRRRRRRRRRFFTIAGSDGGKRCHGDEQSKENHVTVTSADDVHSRQLI